MIGVAFWMRALASWRPQKVAIVAPASAHALQISPDGRFLMAGFRAFYDLEGEKRVPSVPTGEGFYGFAPNRTYFSVEHFYREHPIGEFEKPNFPNRAKISRREIATGQVVWNALDSTVEQNNITLAIALSGDGKQVLVCGEANFKVFDAKNGTLLWRRAAPRIDRGRWVKGGRFLWGSVGRQIFLSETATGRVVWRHPASDWARRGGVSPDESVAWAVSEMRAPRRRFGVTFYDLKSGRQLWSRHLDSAHSQSRWSPAFSRDGARVAIGNWTGVEWFEAQTGQRIGSRRGIGYDLARAMAFSHDGDFLYTCDKNGQIWKWRLK